MFKSPKFLFLFIFCSYFLVLPTFIFAEEITITTYYPSPYGAYNELQSNKLSVGDINDDGQLSSADQPPANGQLYTARSVILKPQSALPAVDAREGELVYNSADKKLYYYDGSGWVAQGGSGKVLYEPKCSWNCGGSGLSHTCSSSCVPPNCSAGYTSLGGGCVQTSTSTTGTNDYSGSGYCERYCLQN